MTPEEVARLRYVNELRAMLAHFDPTPTTQLMTRSPEINEIAKALASAQGAMSAAPKSGKNPYFSSTYSTHQDVWDACAKHLHTAGIAIWSNTDSADDAGINVYTTLLHTSGQWIQTALRVPVDKATAHAVASAVTYGRRITLAMVAGVVSEDDDDGNAAVGGSTVAASAMADRPKAPPVTPGADRGEIMPFGRNKGQPLASMTSEGLESALDWCRTKDAVKFKELIASLSRVLAARAFADNPPVEEWNEDSP